MDIVIGDEYDGFTIVIDGEHYRIDQEDDMMLLVQVFEKACPNATVSYEEWY